MQSKIRLSSLVILTLLVLLILPVHAATYVGYTQSNQGTNTCAGGFCGSCTDPAANGQTCGTGLSLLAPLSGKLVAVTILAGTVLATQVLISTFQGTTPPSTGENCNTNGAATCQSTNGAQSYTLQDAESLSGLVAGSFATITLANPVTVTNGQWVAVDFTSSNCSGSLGSSCLINTFCGSGCGSSGSQNGLVQSTCIKFGSSTPSIGSTFTTATPANCTIDTIVGGTFQTTATTAPTTTQCYGNCGTPAVTLANTNSTHSTNFNQSITVFYIAQSNLNGFVANVTTQVAKTYSNGETIAIGLYTVDPVCTASNNPFTPQCPGFLVQRQGLSMNPSKGAFSMTSNVAIQNGQWFGLAVTGGFQGLDLNDTNTNVALNQASGQIPTVISQYTGLGTSKLALYAFVRGNSIIIAPGGGQIPAGCQTVTCGILAIWGALGGDVAAGIGGFLIVLGLIVGFLLYISRQHNPDGSIKGFAVPVELLGIIAVLVLIMFSVAGAIPAWIPGVIIFLVAGFFVAGIWGHRRHANTVQG